MHPGKHRPIALRRGVQLRRQRRARPVFRRLQPQLLPPAHHPHRHARLVDRPRVEIRGAQARRFSDAAQPPARPRDVQQQPVHQRPRRLAAPQPRRIPRHHERRKLLLAVRPPHPRRPQPRHQHRRRRHHPALDLLRVPEPVVHRARLQPVELRAQVRRNRLQQSLSARSRHGPLPGGPQQAPSMRGKSRRPHLQHARVQAWPLPRLTNVSHSTYELAESDTVRPCCYIRLGCRERGPARP